MYAQSNSIFEGVYRMEKVKRRPFTKRSQFRNGDETTKLLKLHSVANHHEVL